MIRNMFISFPVVLCLIGAFSWFLLGWKLRNLRVSPKAPPARGHLSLRERQRKVTIASWILLGGSLFFLLGAAMLVLLQHR